jgi:16S rRNA (cytosine967-C5)-methyltransferase
MMDQIQLAAAQVVQQVLDGRNLNQVLELSQRESNKQHWDAGHRAALQDLSYGTLRYLGSLRAVLKLLLHKPLSDERIHFLLLVSLYQLVHSKNAPHAVVDHAVRAAGVISPRVGGLVNAVLRNFLRKSTDLLARAANSVEGKYNHPEGWVKKLTAQLGAQAEAVLEAGNTHPPMTLRVNRRHSTVDDYMSLLQAQDIPAECVGEDAILLQQPIAVNKLPGFFDGASSVQDAGAQFSAGLLDVSDGMRVLDACAAPGGKTAHILECAEVEMVAVDKDEKRLQRVADNLQRLQLSASLAVGDALQPDTWWDGKLFQRILADVPCSASGVVRRHPDIKWLRRESDIAKFAAQQFDILTALWRLLEQNGKLLYVTCSVFQEENEQVISKFLKYRSDVRRIPIVLPSNILGQLLPNDQHDGFFYALLQKIT